MKMKLHSVQKYDYYTPMLFTLVRVLYLLFIERKTESYTYTV